jgi:DNA-binding PadR family transcriptional regulator
MTPSYIDVSPRHIAAVEERNTGPMDLRSRSELALFSMKKDRARARVERSDLFAVTENRYAGYTVYDDAGEKIGNVDDLYFVNGNCTPKYVGVQTGPLGLRRTLVSMDIVHVNERRQLIEVFESKERAEDAPTLDGDEKIILAFEQQVRSFFGVVSDGVLEIPSPDWITPFLLVILRERDCYGHELAQQVIDFNLGATRPEAVYRALRQMEKEGIVVSKSKGPGSEPCSLRYSITALGETYLEYLANVLGQYSKEVNLLFRFYKEQHMPEGCSRSTATRIEREKIRKNA